MLKAFKNMMRFLFEAFGRIFSPRNDHYPATGIQPFSGDRPGKHRAA